MKILKKISLLILLVSSLLYSCKEKQEKTVKLKSSNITGMLNQANFKNLQLHQIANGIRDVIEIKEDGSFDKTLKINDSDLYTIKQGRNEYYFFLQPAEQIKIQVNPKDSMSLVFAGELSAENKYLQQYADIKQHIYENVSFRDIAKLDSSEFLDKYKARNKPLDSLLAVMDMDKKLNAKFKKLLQLRLDATKGNGLIQYPQYYNTSIKKRQNWLMIISLRSKISITII